MLFFTRSLLCIGTIVVLAEGPAQLWDTSNEAVTAAGQAASQHLQSICARDPARCLALAGPVAGSVAAGEQTPAPDRPPSRPTRDADSAHRPRPVARTRPPAPEAHN